MYAVIHGEAMDGNPDEESGYLEFFVSFLFQDKKEKHKSVERFENKNVVAFARLYRLGD